MDFPRPCFLIFGPHLIFPDPLPAWHFSLDQLDHVFGYI
jgi:hypothetical protein